VAALACALAKAQAELVNPEKSLTATIRTGRAGEGERSFRYAPLASGLDIVRKVLGQHEIATLQTTAIDQSAGIVNLTTMLAHASGEWIASDWPVCPIAEMASPRRMGAALTYARRYALFTLVGIAGEDDLDAPDLAETDPTASPRPSTNGASGGAAPRPSGNGSAGRTQNNNATAPILEAGQSAALLDRLLDEIAPLASEDAAAGWAHDRLGAKNSLTAADAKRVEVAFEQRLTEISRTLAKEQLFPAEPASRAELTVEAAEQPEASQPPHYEDRDDGHRRTGIDKIDKSVLAVAAPRRYRNKDHLRHVARQACLVCGRKPCDPHHLRFMQPRALGSKVSDEFTVPLCRIHHRALHRTGDEAAWWKAEGIDPIKVARKLWRNTRLGEQKRGKGAAPAEPPQAQTLARQANRAAGPKSDSDVAAPAGRGSTP
jgi:hypothetical protein